MSEEAQAELKIIDNAIRILKLTRATRAQDFALAQALAKHPHVLCSLETLNLSTRTLNLFRRQARKPDTIWDALQVIEKHFWVMGLRQFGEKSTHEFLRALYVQGYIDDLEVACQHSGYPL